MIIKPDFYDKFKCIGSDCSFTCCQEWKIAVDDSTASVWKNTAVPEGVKSRRRNLEQFTQYKDGGRVISLDNYICPFLNEEKLCRLVCAYGDEILSETCAVFPREKHEFEDRTEWSLMPCCPEVIDLILNPGDGDGGSFLAENENIGTISPITAETECGMDGKRSLRKILMDLLSDESHSCQVELLAAFYILTEVNRLEKIDVPSILESVPKLCEMIEGMDFDIWENMDECRELFYDLTENYRRENRYRELLDELYEYAELEYDEEKIEKFAADWHKYEFLFHKLLTQEVYADLLNNGSEISDMTVRFQWIGLEYALIRQMCFMYFLKKEKLDYSQVRTYIVLVCRMMGYEEEDIYEYLENSFEDILWEWGYMALVIGK